MIKQFVISQKALAEKLLMPFVLVLCKGRSILPESKVRLANYHNLCV